MWRYQDAALCVNDEYADAWFPEEVKRQAFEYSQRATHSTSTCRRCPVQAECLAWAIELTTEAQHGTLGGLTLAARNESRIGKRVYHGQRAEDQYIVKQLTRKAT